MNEKTITRRTVYKGRLLQLDVLDVERDNGMTARREVVRHPGAVAVLARLPGSRFILVRQFRKPLESEILEIVAGCLEAGERPETCAVREVKEETGYKVRSLESLGTIWPAPGYSSERLHVFAAMLAPKKGRKQPDEDEDLETVELGEADMERMIARSEISDAKTLAAWCLWKARKK